MPNLPLKACRQPGCPKLTKGRFCDDHAHRAKELRKEADLNRLNARQRGYTRRWEIASLAFRKAHPICAIDGPRCEHAATLVDHIVPHRGDAELFWDVSNWQSACKPCHDAKTGRGE